jgi:hypothetical protein
MNEPKRMWKIPAAIYFFHGLAADPMNICLRNSIRKSSISRTLCIPRKLLASDKKAIRFTGPAADYTHDLPMPVGVVSSFSCSPG